MTRCAVYRSGSLNSKDLRSSCLAKSEGGRWWLCRRMQQIEDVVESRDLGARACSGIGETQAALNRAKLVRRPWNAMTSPSTTNRGLQRPTHPQLREDPVKRLTITRQAAPGPSRNARQRTPSSLRSKIHLDRRTGRRSAWPASAAASRATVRRAVLRAVPLAGRRSRQLVECAAGEH